MIPKSLNTKLILAIRWDFATDNESFYREFYK